MAANFTVVVSAGNYGRTADGAPVLGGITSPGNSPFAITVGSLDIAAPLIAETTAWLLTVQRTDPLRLHVQARPGCARARTCLGRIAERHYIVRTYPRFHVAGRGTNAYMRLSGTSMAPGVVSGGVALLLDADPT